MSDRNERPCTYCGSFYHHEDDCNIREGHKATPPAPAPIPAEAVPPKRGIMDDVEMAALSPHQQAQKAIHYALTRIAEHPGLGWYCGPGTQTFALLTEAAATLFSVPVREIRERFLPKNAKNPEEKSEAVVHADTAESTVAKGLDLDGPDLCAAVDGLMLHERRPALALLTRSFCQDCGELIVVGPCFCRPRRLKGVL